MSEVNQMDTATFFMFYRGVNVIKKDETKYLLSRAVEGGEGEVFSKEFNVTDMPIPFGVSKNSHIMIIQHGIDVLRGVLWEEGGACGEEVLAEFWTESGLSVEVDIAPWLIAAKASQIQGILSSCPEESVVMDCLHFMKEMHYKAAGFMAATSIVEGSSYSVRLDHDIVKMYLAEQKPNLSLGSLLLDDAEISHSSIKDEDCMGRLKSEGKYTGIEFDVGFWVEIQSVGSLSNLLRANWVIKSKDVILEVAKQSCFIDPRAKSAQIKLKTLPGAELVIDGVKALEMLKARLPSKLKDVMIGAGEMIEVSGLVTKVEKTTKEVTATIPRSEYIKNSISPSSQYSFIREAILEQERVQGVAAFRETVSVDVNLNF